MNTRNPLKLWLISLILLGVMASCEENSLKPGGSDSSDGVSNDLHLAFKTPDWEKKIDCSHLDLPSFDLSEEVLYTFASSASTKNTFMFSFPKDSSDMVAKGNLKKYAIAGFGENAGPFEFSFKVPETSGSDTYLISETGFSEKYFNEVVSITYVSSTADEAIFQVKCKYKLRAAKHTDSEDLKDISGTFHFKIRTSRN